MKSNRVIGFSVFFSILFAFQTAYSQETLRDPAQSIPAVSFDAAQSQPDVVPPAPPADFFSSSPLSPATHSENESHQFEGLPAEGAPANGPVAAESPIPTVSSWTGSTVTWGIDYTSVEQYFMTASPATTANRRAGFFETVRQAFAQWAQYVPLTFQEVAANTAQIIFTVLSESVFDTSVGGPNNYLAYAYYPTIGDVFLDGGRSFGIPAVSTGGVSYAAINGGFSLLAILIHEIGHTLGIGHADTDSTSVMYPFVSNQNVTVAPNDVAVAAVQSLYGAGTGSVVPLTPTPVHFVGVTEGQTVNGVVRIGPNLTQHPDVRKVAYYLDGQKSGKVYSSPFFWGGLNGTGIEGFDTRTLTNGAYSLSMTYTDSTGDHSVTINFNIQNDGINPVIQPKLTGIVEGASVNGIVNISPDLTTFGTIQNAQYFVDGVNRGLSTVTPYRWGGNAGFDTTALANGAHVLRTVVTDQNGPHEIFINFTVNNPVIPNPGTSDFIGVIEGAVLSGVVNISTNLTKYPGVRKVFYYLNGTQSGKYYAAPFTWGGASGFDTRTLSNGVHTLAMSYTDNTGDHTASVTFTVNNSGVVQPKLSGLTEGAAVNGVINVVPDLATFGTIQNAQYFIDGVNRGTNAVSPFRLGGNSGFDTTTLTNGAHVLRAVVTDQNGPREITLNFTVNNPVVPPVTNDFVGVTSGAVLSGVVNVGPNLTKYPGVRKVFYYLNGTQSGKYYAVPFTWGGTSGFDTRTLPNGTHTLAMSYTDNTGDHTVMVTFTVQN